jgi:hypothetical protein
MPTYEVRIDQALLIVTAANKTEAETQATEQLDEVLVSYEIESVSE